MSKVKFKKKVIYTQKYNKGVFNNERKGISGIVLNEDTWIEMVDDGANDDGTQFITIKLNNIKPENHPLVYPG